MGMLTFTLISLNFFYTPNINIYYIRGNFFFYKFKLYNYDYEYKFVFAAYKTRFIQQVGIQRYNLAPFQALSLSPFACLGLSDI